jgi:hypothetical protein
LTRFLHANRYPSAIKRGAGFRSKTLLRNTRASSRRHAIESQCIARCIVPRKIRSLQWQFWAISAADAPPLELIEATGVRYSGTACEVKMRTLESTFPFHRCRGDVSMTLTVAHISPIISVIAGVLILIIPRLLNLIVALFLILNGLIGLGLLRWLHL